MDHQSIPPFRPPAATPWSIARRKPLYGVGVNDALYQVNPLVNGKQVMCPYYTRWAGMLERCYCSKSQARRPTYRGCSVVPEWLSFMAFRKWMLPQDWEGMHLDKDLLHPGNKVYGPGTCVFIDHAANTLLSDNKAARGAKPTGVYRHKRGRYHAHCSIRGKKVHLGTYDTPEQAHAIYLVAKTQEVVRVALLQGDDRVRDALLAKVITGVYVLPD